MLARIVAAEPSNRQACWLLAAAQLGNCDFEEAAASASRAVALWPSDDWPYRVGSSAQLFLGNVTAAQEACKLGPHMWRNYVCLARACLATKVEFDGAERAITNALRLTPGEADVHFVAGQVSFARERWNSARAHHERALALNPAHSGALNGLGRIRLQRRDHVGAARHFIRAARSSPDVGTYARNVEVAIRGVIVLSVIALFEAGLVLLYLAAATRASRGTIVIGYTIAAAIGVGFAALQLWRMPREVLPLLRTRRIALVLSVVYGAILTAVITVAVTPAAALPVALLAATAIVVASPFVGLAILHRKKDRTVGRNVTRDRAA